MKIEVISRKAKSADSSVPILCVHGGYHGAWCWDEYFLRYFAEHGHDAYALSLRGHGGSDGHERINRWRVRDYVEDVRKVAAQISPNPVLIGHSLGGVVVQKYLELYSAPAGILLASSPLSGMASASLRTMMRYPLPMLKMFLTANMLHARPTFESVFFQPSMPREKVKAYFEKMGNESFTAFMDIMLFDKPKPERVNVPMMVVGGEFDHSIAPAINENLAKAYHTRLETFPVAHDMMLDANWESVARQIVNWLEKI